MIVLRMWCMYEIFTFTRIYVRVLLYPCEEMHKYCLKSPRPDSLNQPFVSFYTEVWRRGTEGRFNLVPL